MKSLDVLLLVDNKPGHYHLAEGVIAALERLVEIRTTRMEVHQRFWAPGRLLSKLVIGNLSPGKILRHGYGVMLEDLPPADLVISAGGKTLAANIAASRALAADNIFVGSLRRFPAENFSAVITSYARYAKLPRHLVSLKPCKLDPAVLGRPGKIPVFDAINPPKSAGMLLGGEAPGYLYKDSEWRAIVDLVRVSNQAWGTKWQISNSRRTPNTASNLFADAAARSDGALKFIDYRTAGPGSLLNIFSTSDVIACTEDSSTMISEAIAARIPVVGLTPGIHNLTPQEQEYRQYLQQNNWTASLAIAELNPQSLARTLSNIRPMEENHLDLLADKLKQRLPELLS